MDATAANALADALLIASLRLLEKKKRSYYYDTVGVKRWILGDGGRAGNCENCVEQADLGWVDQDYTYDVDGYDVDEPPAHPHCTCSLEYGEKRKRVYV